MTDSAIKTVATTTVALTIGGMTCASCAAHITKRLNKLDGVEASVNYATEQASIVVTEAVTTAELIAQVEAIGYTARVPASASEPTSADDPQDADIDPEVRALRNRLIGAAVRFEFVNGSTVVRTLTDSSFWRARQIAPPVGTTDALETVRPNRHVRTLVSLLELGDKPSVVWDVPRVRASSEPLRENGSRERRCSCRRKNERRVSIPPIGGISNSIRS